jgi:hypothetical protein
MSSISGKGNKTQINGAFLNDYYTPTKQRLTIEEALRYRNAFRFVYLINDKKILNNIPIDIMSEVTLDEME